MALVGATPLKDHQSYGAGQKAQSAMEKGFWLGVGVHLQLLKGGHALQIEYGHDQNANAY